VLQGNAEPLDMWGEKTKHPLISYFLDSISAKKYRNRIAYVNVDYSKSNVGRFLRHSVIFGRPFVKRFAICYRTVVLSVCPVCNIGVLWPNGWMDQDATWYGGRPRPSRHCVRWAPSSIPRKGAQQPPLFGPLRSGMVAHLSNSWAVVILISECRSTMG